MITFQLFILLVSWWCVRAGRVLQGINRTEREVQDISWQHTWSFA